MAVLYLLQQNTVLRKSGKRLLFCRQRERKTTTHLRQDDVLIDLPIDDVQHVMLFGNIQITTQAMHTLLFNGVETAIYSLSGKLIGQLTPPGGRNIELRIRQFDAYKDTGYRLNFARMILKYKFLATHDFLLDYNHNHPGCFSLDELAAFRQAADRIDAVSDSAQLLGHEGSVSALYFKLLGRMLPAPWKFTKRTRRPPQDAANAVLSFGYTVLASELQSLLDGAGFDPYLGFYHEIVYGRPALALDIMEPFRHALIDRLMVRLFSLGILTNSDFSPPPQGGIYLSESGKRKYFEQYEKLMGTYRGETSMDPNSNKYRRLLQEEIGRLARALMDEKAYVPSRLNKEPE